MTAFRCCRCHQPTGAPIAMRHIERPSGAGFTLYACPDCALHVPPGPLPAETVSLPCGSRPNRRVGDLGITPRVAMPRRRDAA